MSVAALEGRVGFEPTTPGPKVPGPSAELAVRQDQGPRAGMRNGLALDQARPDDLPRKQGLAHRRLVTYVVTSSRGGAGDGNRTRVTCLEGTSSPHRAGLIANPSDSKIGVKPGWNQGENEPSPKPPTR